MCDSPMCSNGQLGNAGSPLPSDPALTAATMPVDLMQSIQKAGAFLGSPTTVDDRSKGNK